MKNMKRIFAITGIVLLIGLYAATLIFALIDSPWAMDCLKISFGLTIIIPILLWIYIAMFRHMEQQKKSNTDAMHAMDAENPEENE